jgi:hypothetical protein
MHVKRKKPRLPAPDASAPTIETQEEILVLDVGGRQFKTTSTTLTKFMPESMLARMFSQEHRVRLKRQADGSIFIDRNGDMFAYILDAMRNQNPEQLRETPKNITPSRWLAELDFYGLRPVEEPSESSESESVDTEEETARKGEGRRKLSSEIAQRYSTIARAIAERIANTTLFKKKTLSSQAAKTNIDMYLLERDIVVDYDPGQGLPVEKVDAAKWIWNLFHDARSNDSDCKDRAKRACDAMANVLRANWVQAFAITNLAKQKKEKFWRLPDLNDGPFRVDMSDKDEKNCIAQLTICF